jgi:hypothetical protein
MNGKILGICICTLLIATALPAVGTLNKDDMNTTPQQVGDIEWEYTYGYDAFDWLYCIEPISDGGYIATGLAEEDDMYYAWLLKVDENGVEQWSRLNYEFNGTSIENDIIIQCVRETPDGGYLVGGLGRYYDTFHGEWSVSGYLWKTDSEGITEWLKPFVNEEEEWIYVPFVFETYDDMSWIIGGFYAQGSGINLDVALFKTDLDGNLLWSEHYHEGTTYEFARSLCKTSDGYFLSGSSIGLLMLTTDNDGIKNWSKTFNGPGGDFSAVMGCRQTTDGGYIMSGITDSYGAGGTDLWIIKTDENGDMEWNKTYGGPNHDRHYGMDGTEDGGYVFVAIKDAYVGSGTKEDTWIINTDSEGNSEWELLIEKDGTQWMQSIVQTDDGGFIVAGRTGAMGSPDSDGLIMKIGPFPHLYIEVTGGLGIDATITNNGEGDVVQAPWEITVTGGLLGMINKTYKGTIDIDSGATETISSGLILGLGRIQITISVGIKEETTEGLQLLFFSMI